MLTLAQIRPYLVLGRPEAKYIHEFYQKSIDLKAHLKEVFGDEYPKYMNVARPGEKLANKKHRAKIYQNPFRSLPRRISEVLDYIRQADDYNVTFPAEIPKGIKPEDSLEAYTKNSALTPEGDMEEFFFSKVVPRYVRDPNAVIITIPHVQPTSKYEYPKPIPTLVPCENVIMHRKGVFCAMKAPFTNKFLDKYNVEQEGLVYIFCDHESYCIARQVAKQVDGSGIIELAWQIDGLYQEILETGEQIELFQPPLHFCTKMPAMKIGKIIAEENDKGETYCESILSDALPFIKGGQQTWNDKDIEKNQHLSSQEYRYVNKKCNSDGCVNGTIIKRNGSGKIIGEEECPKCKGSGLMPSGSGLDIWYVDTTADGGEPSNAPRGIPGGFIPRSIAPYIELSKDYENLKKDVLTTLNMQYVINTNSEASGTSKRYDREEGYREVNTQGAHIINIMGQQYSCTENIRYGLIKRPEESQTPSIIVPIRLNLENAELTREELNDAKSKGYDPAIIEALERKLIQYIVGENSDLFKRYETKVSLDPFRSLTIDQKNMAAGLTFAMLKEGTQRTSALKELFLSIYFDSLIVSCVNKHADFYQKEVSERNTILRTEFQLVFGEIQEGNELSQSLPTMSSFNIKPPSNLQEVNQTAN